MALDTKLVQNIGLRVTDASALERPLKTLGTTLNKLVKDMQQIANPSTAEGRKQIDLLAKAMGKVVGEAKTLQQLLDSGTRAGRAKNSLLGELNDQAMGKKVLSASRLRQELTKTTSSADALEIRLAQLYKSFNKLTNAGRSVGGRDISKALGFQNAITQARQLEREIERLDRRATARGGVLPPVRGEIGTLQTSLLTKVQGGRRVDFTKELGQLNLLVEKYRQLTRAEEAATSAAQKRALTAVNLSESQLRAQVERGASRFSFTPAQARGFNIPQINKSVEADMQRLVRLQDAMSRALAQGRSEAVINRLSGAWSNLTGRISQAIAMQKAFEALPEQRMRKVNDLLFAGGGLEFGKRIFGASVIASGAFATINALQNGARFVVEFEDSLKQLQAISGATDTEMGEMSETILDVAKNTKFSAVEITQAATQIAQAGFSVQETGQVLRDALTLATASGSSPTEAVETLTGALGAFQLQASESTHVVDVMVSGLNRSKLTISQMQAALQYAGATAKESGIRFEELVTIAASLANAGIRTGSTIGTGLRQLIVDLQTPTEKFKKELKDLGLTMADVDLKSKGLAGVVKTLTDAGFSAEAAYESFETRAASAFLAFRNQIDTYDELSQSILASGAAAEANAKAMDSLSAKWTKMLNSLAALVTTLGGPFIDALKLVVDVLGGVFSGLDLFVNKIGELIPALGGFDSSFKDAFVFGVAGFFIGGPWGAIIGALGGFIAGLNGSTAALDEMQAKAAEAESKLQSQNQTIDELDDAIKSLIDRQVNLKDGSAELTNETLILTGKFEGLAAELVGTAEKYDELLNAMLRYRGEALQQQKLTAQEQRIAQADLHEAIKPQLQANRDRALAIKNQPFFNAPQFAIDATTITDHSLAGQNRVQAALVRLKAEKNQNGAIKGLIEVLEERLNLLRQMAAAHAKVNQADRAIGLADARLSKEGQGRYQSVLDLRGNVDRGLEANQRDPGSGTTLINSTLRQAKQALERFRSQLATLDPNSADALDIKSTIREIEAQMARVTRANRISAEDKSLKNTPGHRLSISEIQSQIQKVIPAAHFTDGQRSASRQAGYDRAAGIRRNPNSAPHVQGRALDMRPIPGMDPMEVVAILEDMGLEVTGAPVHADGIRYITPNHGTAPHWHFEWKNKTTQFERRQNASAEKAARELQSLLEQRAGFQTQGQSKRVTAIINEAKAGSKPVDELSTELNQALREFSLASLHEFDVKNPTDGMGPSALTARNEAREALKKKIEEDIRNFQAQFYRQVADTALDAMKRALDDNQRELDEALRKADTMVEAAERKIAIAENRVNRHDFGAGDQYRLDRNKETVDQTAQASKIQAQRQAIFKDMLAVSHMEAVANALPEGEEKKAQLAEVAKRWEDIHVAIEAATKAQADYNAEFGKADFGSMGDRLRDAARAWMENSGAMDSWGKMAQDAVGPILDQLTASLGDFFYSIMSGTKGVKQALAEFLKSFASFVLQMIARALALKLVQTILNSLGLGTPSYDGGPVVAHAPTGVVGPRFNGGYTHDIPGRLGGGYINRGVSNRDSALYNLAAGEYVVRNKSVREIGMANMEMINRFGAKGLKKVAGSGFTNIQAPKQEVNVWVVKEDEKPQLGPGDILVTVHKDIMEGGATKKLIKQVSQGA